MLLIHYWSKYKITIHNCMLIYILKLQLNEFNHDHYLNTEKVFSILDE